MEPISQRVSRPVVNARDSYAVGGVPHSPAHPSIHASAARRSSAAGWGGSLLATATVGACHTVVTAEAGRYHTEMLGRETALAEADPILEAQAAVQPLSAQPAIFPLDMLPYQSQTALPGEMHRFFAMQRLAERYGAGEIPQEEWEALDAWNSES